MSIETALGLTSEQFLKILEGEQIEGNSEKQCIRNEQKTVSGRSGHSEESGQNRVYAVEKDRITEMKNEAFEDKEELKKSVAEYGGNGFKVHYNS